MKDTIDCIYKSLTICIVLQGINLGLTIAGDQRQA